MTRLCLMLLVGFVFVGCAVTVEQVKNWEKERAVKPLLDALKDENMNVREAAAKALREIKDARAVEPLIVALKDEWMAVPYLLVVNRFHSNGEVSGYVTKMYPGNNGNFEYQKATDEIVIRHAKLATLGNMWKVDSKEAAEALEKIGKKLPTASPSRGGYYEERWTYPGGMGRYLVREAAAWALGEIGDKRAIKPLEELAQSGSDSDVRQAAKEALAKIREK